MGHTSYPLSQQIADTIAEHGYLWAHWHYTVNVKGPRLSSYEWRILAPVGDRVMM